MAMDKPSIKIDMGFIGIFISLTFVLTCSVKRKINSTFLDYNLVSFRVIGREYLNAITLLCDYLQK